jgi:signal transduction histidine kinase
VRTTLQRRLARTFLALLVVTTVGVALAVVVAVRLVAAQEQVVERLFDSYEAAADVNQALVDQETGFRGYALTGDEDFLGPYRGGAIRAERALRRLERIEADFPALRPRRVAVVAAAEDWRRTVAEPGIAAVDAGRTLDRAALETSRLRFDAVRSAVEDDRGALLAQREDRVEDLRRGVVLLFLGFGAGLLLLVAAATLTWVALRRWVTGPLTQLGAAVDRVEGGDLSRQVAIEDAPQEIRDLAEQVDRMRVRILHEFALAEESRVRAEEAQALVEEQAEDLRRSNAELEQFAYVASHDLQEPLRKVASFCQLIERRYKGQLDERGDQYIEFAVDGAKRMQQLINDLLAFSRVGRHTSGFETVSLESVLAGALRQLEAAVEETGAEVTHDPLPEVEGEAGLLVQLFQNLIGNALKFRAEEAPRVHIGARPAPGEPDVWELSCTDNGIGIDEQYEDKIFVIFQRLHGRDAYGGTGIGLAMCKKIVEHHGGRLWLDSTEPGGGSTFRWTLPAAASTTTAADATAAEPGDGTNDTNDTNDTDDRVDIDERDEGTADDRAAGAAGRDLARGGRPG